MVRWMFEDSDTMSVWSLWYAECLRSVVRWVFEVCGTSVEDCGTMSTGSLWHGECLKSVVRWEFKVCGTMGVWRLWHDGHVFIQEVRGKNETKSSGFFLNTLIVENLQSLHDDKTLQSGVLEVWVAVLWEDPVAFLPCLTPAHLLTICEQASCCL